MMGGGREKEQTHCPFKNMTRKRNMEFTLLTSYWAECSHMPTLGCKGTLGNVVFLMSGHVSSKTGVLLGRKKEN